MQIQTSTETVAYSTDRDKVELSELAKKITTYAKDAVESSHDALHSAIAAGEHLYKAKERVFHGKWTPWLRENFKFSHNTATDWIMLYKHKKELLELLKGQKDQYMSVQDALKLCGAAKTRPELTKYQLVQKRHRDFIREIYNQTAADKRRTRELIIEHQRDVTAYLKSHD
jgi:hypothetical protein